jgi:hypothetical protein
MKAISPKSPAPAKPTGKVKPLSPRKDPKGGRRGGGGCDDEFGCSGNHNEVVVSGGRA